MCSPLELRVQETTKNGTTTVKKSESRTRSDRNESDFDLLLDITCTAFIALYSVHDTFIYFCVATISC